MHALFPSLPKQTLEIRWIQTCRSEKRRVCFANQLLYSVMSSQSVSYQISIWKMNRFRKRIATLLFFLPAFVLYTSVSSRNAIKCSITSENSRGTALVEGNFVGEYQDLENRYFYHNTPSLFVQNFSRCLFDRHHCHLLYFHVQKTGGSYIASRLYYSNNEPYNSKQWCCNGQFMKEKFRKDPLKYCSMSMGVYEVRPEHYKEIIQTCQDLRMNLTSPEGEKMNSKEHRFMGLLSIREPIQRSLSGIHQRCNVHSGKLDENTMSICKRCSYSGEDESFYDSIVNNTNEVYVKMRDDLVLDASIDIPLFLIDNDYLSVFFANLESRIDSKLRSVGSKLVENSTFSFPRGKRNAEATSKLCNFGMPSKVMKNHQPALEAYRDLWISR